ncbi:MAG: dihydrofolate reductase family protein [Verrucomicrobiae bacterium]|nr:dihydrofolate reductase family protein [Verrucomicrobiae bacterium]
MQRRRWGLPYVIVNMAISADGKIATANHAVSSFGSKLDRERLLELRATADAVMSGARTVQTQRVNLGPGPARFRRARVERGLAEYNLRIIVSGRARISPRAHVFTKRFSPIIVLTTRRAPRQRLQQLEAAGAVVKVCGTAEVNFRTALRWLRQRWGVKRLVCEGGGELNDALFRAGLVDEVRLTLCPVIFGGATAPTIADGVGVPALGDAACFRLESVEKIGDELFLVFKARR